MRILKSALSVLLIIAGLSQVPLVYAGNDLSLVIADHLEQALIYEEKATEQDRLIADQVQKMTDYRATHSTDEKIHPTGRIEAMEEHCKAVIKSAEKLKSEFRRFADWHRQQADELRKKSN